MNIVAGAATANGATIITILGSKYWTGYIHLSGSLASPAMGGAQSDQPTVTVQGAGSEFPSGTVVARIALSTPTTLGTGVAVSTDSSVIPLAIDNSGNFNPVTLRLNHASTNVSAVAVGRT